MQSGYPTFVSNFTCVRADWHRCERGCRPSCAPFWQTLVIFQGRGAHVEEWPDTQCKLACMAPRRSFHWHRFAEGVCACVWCVCVCAQLRADGNVWHARLTQQTMEKRRRSCASGCEYLPKRHSSREATRPHSQPSFPHTPSPSQVKSSQVNQSPK
jgi:hypothetical protein